MLEGGMQIVQGFFGRNEDGGLVFLLRVTNFTFLKS